MRRYLLSLSVLLMGLTATAQTVVLENFEEESGITWEAINGTYNGTVDNPEDTTGINASATVGSYTKSGEHAFSLFVGNLTDSIDLTEANSRFSIQVNAEVATRVLMKLEGNGTPVEMTKNIATPGAWRTYTFDFSAAVGELRVGRIVLFFDPGVEESNETYLFDNITTSPGGSCAGVELDPTVIDDFECQRNTTYGEPGFDDIEVIANPDLSGINTSDSVGQYTDREGGFHALVIDYNSAIDLSTNNNVCIKVWAPVAGDLLVKLQGGTSTPIEKRVAITEVQSWQELCVSFAEVAEGDFEQLVFFFNVGVDEAAGDIYYIDDITITPSPAAEALEDFEGGAALSWGPANDDESTNGTFDGAVINPDQRGANTSETVGTYTRAATNFSTLTAALPAGIDLSGNPQLNLDVWVPQAPTTVTLQLVSATQNPQSVTADVAEAQSWQTLNFDFTAAAAVTDFERINIQFAPGTSTTGTYLYDNLIQGAATADPCADVEADSTILDDFDCQRNATYTDGADFLSVVDNPDVDEDLNDSPQVGAFDDQAGEPNDLTIDLGGSIDLSLNNQLSATVWSPVEGQLLFRLEGDDVEDVEQSIDIDTTGAWSTYTADFSSVADVDGYTRVVLFFGAGEENTEVNTYFVDDIRLRRANYVSSCVTTFDDTNFSVTDWSYFANGSNSDNEFFTVENPDTTGINGPGLVGVFEEASDSEQTFAGLVTSLGAPVALPDADKSMSIKVWMEVAGTVTMKLEGGLDGAAGSGDNDLEYTTPGEWQELVYDFSGLEDGARYERITLIMNKGVVPTEDLIHYFDDIAVGGGDCGNLVSIFNPRRIASLRVYPNPIIDELTIDNTDGATLFTLTNMLGQQVDRLSVDEAAKSVQWPLGELPLGAYLLTARDRSGRLMARTKVVKR